MQIRFRLYVGPVNAKYSPRAGLLALSRVYRSIGLPTSIETCLNCRGTNGNGTVTVSETKTLIEALVLLQASGADCLLDIDALRDDSSLARGLGYNMPGTSRMREFLGWLGRNAGPFDDDSPTGFSVVQSHAVQRIWDTYVYAPGVSLHKQVTLDVVDFAVPAIRHLPWMSPPANVLPRRIAIYWREMDLFLAGGLCGSEETLKRHISHALSSLPQGGSNPLLRCGAECAHTNTLSWLSSQKYRYSVKMTEWIERSAPIGFIVGAEADSEMNRIMEAQTEGWSREGVQEELGIEYRTLGQNESKFSAVGLKQVAIRRRLPTPGEDRFAYSVVITNRDRKGEDVINWFLRGEDEVQQAAFDLDVLARGSNPNAMSELTAEGRFQVAVLTYNLCTAIRQICLEDSQRRISISRLRELLFHASGWLKEHGRERHLMISQEKARQIFATLRRRFPVKEKARVRQRRQTRGSSTFETQAAV